MMAMQVMALRDYKYSVMIYKIRMQQMAPTNAVIKSAWV
jgi:hypothetical protein